MILRVETVCHEILEMVNSFLVVEKNQTSQNIGSIPEHTYLSGFFDGAATSNTSGVGFTLHINSSHLNFFMPR